MRFVHADVCRYKDDHISGDIDWEDKMGVAGIWPSSKERCSLRCLVFGGDGSRLQFLLCERVLAWYGGGFYEGGKPCCIST